MDMQSPIFSKTLIKNLLEKLQDCFPTFSLFIFFHYLPKKLSHAQTEILLWDRVQFICLIRAKSWYNLSLCFAQGWNGKTYGVEMRPQLGTKERKLLGECSSIQTESHNSKTIRSRIEDM